MAAPDPGDRLEAAAAPAPDDDVLALAAQVLGTAREGATLPRAGADPEAGSPCAVKVARLDLPEVLRLLAGVPRG